MHGESAISLCYEVHSSIENLVSVMSYCSISFEILKVVVFARREPLSLSVRNAAKLLVHPLTAVSLTKRSSYDGLLKTRSSGFIRKGPLRVKNPNISLPKTASRRNKICQQTI